MSSATMSSAGADPSVPVNHSTQHGSGGIANQGHHVPQQAPLCPAQSASYGGYEGAAMVSRLLERRDFPVQVIGHEIFDTYLIPYLNFEFDSGRGFLCICPSQSIGTVVEIVFIEASLTLYLHRYHIQFDFVK